MPWFLTKKELPPSLTHPTQPRVPGIVSPNKRSKGVLDFRTTLFAGDFHRVLLLVLLLVVPSGDRPSSLRARALAIVGRGCRGSSCWAVKGETSSVISRLPRKICGPSPDEDCGPPRGEGEGWMGGWKRPPTSEESDGEGFGGRRGK